VHFFVPSIINIYILFYRALLQKRPTILRSLRIVSINNQHFFQSTLNMHRALHIRKTALHLHKRALYIHKRALYICKRALYIRKRALYISKTAIHIYKRAVANVSISDTFAKPLKHMGWQMWLVSIFPRKRALHIRVHFSLQKSPVYPQKSPIYTCPVCSAKEPCIFVKEPYISAIQTHFLSLWNIWAGKCGYSQLRIFPILWTFNWMHFRSALGRWNFCYNTVHVQACYVCMCMCMCVYIIIFCMYICVFIYICIYLWTYIYV